MNSTHFVGVWLDCRSVTARLGDPQMMRALCAKHVSYRHLAKRYKHFTATADGGVIGALSAGDLHIVVCTYPEQRKVLVDLFVGTDNPTDIASAIRIVDALRNELWPIRALWRRVQRVEAAPGSGGRTPVAFTDVLIGPIAVRQRQTSSVPLTDPQRTVSRPFRKSAMKSGSVAARVPRSEAFGNVRTIS